MRVRAITIGFAAASLLAAQAQSQIGTATIDPAEAQRLVGDAAAAAALMSSASPEELAWRYFIALNSPLSGPQPKTWEGWRQTSTVYLPDGSKPLPWGQTPPVPPAVIAQAQQQGLDVNLPFHNLDSILQVDGLTLRDTFRQNVRYQLLMNRDTFQYIYDKGLYNVNGQAALAAAGGRADFPSTAFELKTSWIWIGADQARYAALKDKFYIVNAYYAVVDGSGKPTGTYQVGRAAMSGMHIISKLIPQWLWTTFQNVADDQFTEARNELPMSPAAKAANEKYRPMLQGIGSIFANYQLWGAQWQFVDGNNNAVLLANSQIESAFQSSSSCITCHSTASYSVADGYFNIAKQQNGGITYYTGEPPTDKLKGYALLDFVWSLKRAQWLHQP